MSIPLEIRLVCEKCHLWKGWMWVDHRHLCIFCGVMEYFKARHERRGKAA